MVKFISIGCSSELLGFVPIRALTTLLITVGASAVGLFCVERNRLSERNKTKDIRGAEQPELPSLSILVIVCIGTLTRNSFCMASWADVSESSPRENVKLWSAKEVEFGPPLTRNCTGSVRDAFGHVSANPTFLDTIAADPPLGTLRMSVTFSRAPTTLKSKEKKHHRDINEIQHSIYLAYHQGFYCSNMAKKFSWSAVISWNGS